MNKGIGLAIFAFDKAEAFHIVEELDRAFGLLTRQLTLRCAGAARCAAGAARCAGTWCPLDRFDRHGLTLDLQIAGRHLAAAIDERELERLAFRQTGQAGSFHRADVHEHVIRAIVALDEAEALLAVEEFDDAFAGANDLRRHAAATAPWCAAAGKTAATATAAEAAAWCAATAAAIITEVARTVEAATATAAAVKWSGVPIAVEILVAETIALVTALAAPLTVKTHVLKITLLRPPVRAKQRRTTDCNARCVRKLESHLGPCIS